MPKRPSFQFYPDDHLSEASLRMCTPAARGIWWDMVCYMHQGHPYGHLRVNGRVTTDDQLSLMLGGDREVTMACLRELEQAGVFSRDEEGVIFCRRMVRDEAAREMRVNCGKAGGSAALGREYNKPGFVYAMLRHSDRAVKIGASTNPKQRIYRVRLQFPDDEVTLLGKCSVDDMGAEEARLHGLFPGKANGEWFTLTGEEVTTLIGHLGGDRQGDQGGDQPGDGGGDAPVTRRVVTKQSLPPSSPVFCLQSSSSVEEINTGAGNQSRSGDRAGDHKKRPRHVNADSVDLPEILRTPEFEAAWKDWNTHRREAGKPLTKTSAKQQLAKLESWGVVRAVHALKHSTANGWAGVFEPSEPADKVSNKPGPGQKYDPTATNVGGI